MGQTATEKMLEAASDERGVQAGDTVEVDVDVTWIHETQFDIFREAFEQVGGEVWDRNKALFMIDHFPNPSTQEQADRLAELKAYADQEDIDVVKVGIKHQAWRMLGLARPGAIMVGPDSHTPTAGALGAYATCVGPTDTAVVWNTGKIWLKVPETVRIDIEGTTERYVTPRDVGFHILGELGEDTDYFAEGATVEYGGSYVDELSLDGCQTLANMSTEMGAASSYIEPNEKLEAYLETKVDDDYAIYTSDADADHVEKHTVDVEALSPQVAFPHSPSNVKDVSAAVGLEMDQFFLGSCANGHLEDLRVAADILNGETIAADTDMIVAPATDEIRKQASMEGILDTFVQAGARVSSGYCSACPGYEGILAEGERCLATSTRNYRGRMGHRDSEVYLGSPATVAASAITGEITDPRARMEATK
jgi:3-isopropylmalate/(R)-2-methylmalate dehydratase large subunit